MNDKKTFPSVKDAFQHGVDNNADLTIVKPVPVAVQAAIDNVSMDLTDVPNIPGFIPTPVITFVGSYEHQMQEKSKMETNNPPVYVYLLWHADEYGPEDLKSTLDRSKIPELVESYRFIVNVNNSYNWFEHVGQPNLPQEVKELLDKNTDDELFNKCKDGYNLMNGYGGLNFQVSKLVI